MASSSAPRLGRLVAGLLALLVACSVVATVGLAASAARASAAVTSAAGDAESSFFTLLNRGRVAGGLPALQADPALATMRTLVQSERLELDRGATKLELGPPAIAAFDTLMESVPAFSNDQITYL